MVLNKVWTKVSKCFDRTVGNLGNFVTLKRR